MSGIGARHLKRSTLALSVFAAVSLACAPAMANDGVNDTLTSNDGKANAKIHAKNSASNLVNNPATNPADNTQVAIQKTTQEATQTTTQENTEPLQDFRLYTPEQIENRLKAASQDGSFYRTADNARLGDDTELPSVSNLPAVPNLSSDAAGVMSAESRTNSVQIKQQLEQPVEQQSTQAEQPQTHIFESSAPISRIGSTDAPLGLDVAAITEIPTPDTLTTLGVADETSQTGLDPNAYIPNYERTNAQKSEPVIEVDEIKQDGVLKKLYDRVFNDGVSSVPKLGVHFYTVSDEPNAQANAENLGNSDNSDSLIKLKRSELKQEPYANIKAALGEMTADSVADFRSALPRLAQAVRAAARAVGYYDVQMRIAKAGAGEVNIIIDDVGEPVRVAAQVMEVRGDGAHDEAYQEAVSKAILQENDVFNHGKYTQSKSAIEDVSGEHGYFDGRWLNSSADVVLPDNIADVSLVYDTGTQYEFDNVVFFTFDDETRELTTDPDKLPVKPELLKKLVTFQMGDAYNRTTTRNLSNSLLATGYFNAVNTEIILPLQTQEENGIAFESARDKTGNQASANADSSAQNLDSNLGVNLGMNLDANSNANQNTDPNSTLPDGAQMVDLGDGVSAIASPIEFSTSQVIQDKLALVSKKATQLYNSPDDRLLAIDSSSKNTSILGRISDAVSHVAKMILPDESGDELPQLDGEPPVLANKKTAQQVYEDKKVPLYVFVMADKPRDAQIGVGWGTDTGARLTTKFEHNLVNRNGLQIGSDIRLSEDRKGVDLYASHPLTHPLNDKLNATLSYDDETIDKGEGSFDLRSRTLKQSIGRNIVNENGWNRSYWLRYRLDELETGAPIESWGDLPVKFLDGKPTQEAVLLGGSLSKTVADNLANPMRGYRQYYSLEAGSRQLMSDADMAIARAGIGGVYSFGDNAYGKNRAHQLIGSVNAGYLWADNFDDVPYKLRFFAGGDQSIRGYNYESLSPLSSSGYLTGGQALAVASGEYNYEIMQDVRLGVFADVGNAYDKNFSNDTKVGAGVGVRWASPVGQVRVDVATAVGEKDNPIKLHFFIGTPF